VWLDWVGIAVSSSVAEQIKLSHQVRKKARTSMLILGWVTEQGEL
jgi:hypothetical protein